MYFYSLFLLPCNNTFYVSYLYIYRSDKEVAVLMKSEDDKNNMHIKDEEDEKLNMKSKVMYGYTKGEEVYRDKQRETGKNKDRQMQEIREKNALLPGGDLPGFIPLR